MSGLHEVFDEVLSALEAEGAAGAPASSRGEVAARLLEVLLEQVLDRERASRVVDRLLAAGFLDPESSGNSDAAELAAMFQGERPAISPRTWPILVRFLRLVGEWGDEVSELPTERLRDDLRAVPGVGPGTADAVLLLGLNRAAFPLERGSFRVLARHGWVDPWDGYDEAAETVAASADRLPDALRSTWAGLGHVAARYCKPRAPECEKCPLHPFLPARGAIELD